MILLLLLSSCSRRQEVGERAPNLPIIKEAAGARQRGEAVLKQEESPALPALIPARQEHVMLPLGLGKRALPEDFKIGLLQDRLAGYKEQKELLATVGTFLDDLTRAGVRREALLPEASQSLERYLSFYLDRGLVPTGYRLGAIAYSDGGSPRQARLGVRLFSRETAAPTLAASEGVLYLEMHEDRWLIADLQVDLQSLGNPYVRNEQKFIPSSFRWLAGGS